MSKQTSRIFKEMPLIEKLLHQSISDYDPTCDDAIDEAMKELLHRERLAGLLARHGDQDL